MLQKISKTQARKRFMSFKPFVMVPNKMSPLSFMAITIDEHTNRDPEGDNFEQIVNAFWYYNCCTAESGLRVAFYAEI